jgi:hypothetical protein
MHFRVFNSSRKRIYLTSTFLAFIIIYICLLIPNQESAIYKNNFRKPFTWNQDKKWETIESRFSEAREQGCDSLKEKLLFKLEYAKHLIAQLSLQQFNANDALFDSIEENLFTLGPLIGACSENLIPYLNLIVSMRNAVKEQSIHWQIDSIGTRDRLYRLLYGGRAAVEEVMLQGKPDGFPTTILCHDEPSSTPSAEILGVRIHSGDILVSRGGAPTSALIARGNDYPGNFSHVALAHVDTGGINIIESHIERGVTISKIDDYLKDTKLRVMVLRLRADLPAMINDPMLPHKAASKMFGDARSRHIPYDFAMDCLNPSEMFCSEVVSTAYRQYGITLWKSISTISSEGASSWLRAFGVTHFETQEPSDLEYDPQLSVVAEWRDNETLFKDHVDNAVIDAMLEGADHGDRLTYNWYMLPIGRIAKVYSVLLNLFGGIGPIPEGMNATAALKNKELTTRHAAIKTEVIKKAEAFKQKFGYVPPYWGLLKLARQAATSNEFFSQ